MEPYEFDDTWKSRERNSRIWLARNNAPSPSVSRTQRIIPARSPRSRERTARIIVPLDAMRNSVKIADRAVSSSTPGGGHTRASAFSVKYAANKPPKNISSEASHTTVPTASMDGCCRARVSAATPSATADRLAHGTPRVKASGLPWPGERAGRPSGHRRKLRLCGDGRQSRRRRALGALVGHPRHRLVAGRDLPVRPRPRGGVCHRRATAPLARPVMAGDQDDRLSL